MIDRFRNIVGAKGVVADPWEMAPFLTECREGERGEALCVLQPASSLEVSQILRVAAAEGVAVVPLGGNTGLVSGGLPTGRHAEQSVVLSLGRMNRIREIDLPSGVAWVDAGVILSSLHEAAEAVGRRFNLHLGSEGSAQIGGLISTNAGGTAALRYGAMRDLVAGLEVVLPDGRLFSDMTALRKNNTGYMLRQLFIGAEGTLGVVTGAALRLHPRMAVHEHAWVGVSSAERAVELYSLLQEMAGPSIEACELLSRAQVELVRRNVAHCRIPFAEIPEWSVMVELAAIDQSAALHDLLQRILEKALETGIIDDAVVAKSNQQAEDIWRVRHSLAEANKPAGLPFPLDIAVRTSAIPQFVEQAGIVCASKFPEAKILVIGHLGDGNLHYVLLFPHDYWNGLADKAAYSLEIERAVHDIAVGLGGTYSAEHGIGRKLTAELERLTDPVTYEYMRSIKRMFDPDDRMNPGALFR